VTFVGRDVPEVDALITDRYLDALLASGELAGGAGRGLGVAGASGGAGRAGRAGRRDGPTLDEAVRLASARLTRDLPRFHPSFRFEERLALRLAEAAAAMRLPVAAGAEGATTVIPIRSGAALAEPFDPLADPGPDGDLGELVDLGTLSRPLLIRGAVAASALSLAGAALVAWRRNRSGSPMARAARAAHALRGRPA
jgi:hypothetical protein